MGDPKMLSKMNKPRFTGEVRVGFEVTTSIEPWVSSPPRGLSSGRLTRRISLQLEMWDVGINKSLGDEDDLPALEDLPELVD